MTQTFVASITLPHESQFGSVTPTVSIVSYGGKITIADARDVTEPIESWVQKFIAKNLAHTDKCHGYRTVYNSTAVDDPEDNLGGGVIVYEYDFDDKPMDRYFAPIADVLNEAEYNKRFATANETAIDIIMFAGYRQPEMADDLGVEVQDDVQSLLIAAMMRSKKISNTLFGSINDSIRLASLPDKIIPNGESDDLCLVCACGEAFDNLPDAANHMHEEDSFPGADSNEFDFKIVTRDEAF